MKSDFKPETLIDNTNILVSYLPDGRLFAAKNMENSNLRKLFTAFAAEYKRLKNKIYELSVEDDLANTTNLIVEWEHALGVPDSCLTNTVPIEQRRKQITAKFALMNIQTEDDWKTLALFFGFRIKIEYGTQSSIFPMIFPLYFLGSVKAAKFTMIVTFLGISKPKNVFTATFPIIFDEQNILICLFNKLKPAYVNVLYNWEF